MRAISSNQPLPHPWLRSLETEKSQVAQMQSCQEQPFSLQGDRNSGRAHGGPPALMPGEKCPPETVREPAALRSRGSAGLAFGAPPEAARHCPPVSGARIRTQRREGCPEGRRGDSLRCSLRPRGSGPTESSGRSGQVGPWTDERQSGRTNFWSQPRRPSSSLLLSH